MQAEKDLRTQVAELICAEFPIGNQDREYLLSLVPGATAEELLRTLAKLQLERPTARTTNGDQQPNESSAK